MFIWNTAFDLADCSESDWDKYGSRQRGSEFYPAQFWTGVNACVMSLS